MNMVWICGYYGGGFGFFSLILALKYSNFVMRTSLRFLSFLLSTMESQKKVALWVEKVTLRKRCFFRFLSITKQRETPNHVPFLFTSVAFHIWVMPANSQFPNLHFFSNYITTNQSHEKENTNKKCSKKRKSTKGCVWERWDNVDNGRSLWWRRWEVGQDEGDDRRWWPWWALPCCVL